MKRTGLFLLAACGALGSWLVLGLAPALQLPGKPAEARLEKGARLYRALGCAGCHTQQLAPWDVAADADRGWGPRRTTAPDYAATPVLGRLRLGPDLADAGRRHPDAAWFRAYLRESHPGMPGYAFLIGSPAGDDLVSYLLTLRRP